MQLKELMEKISSPEWTDLEFKESAGGLPKSAYETACAFANTKGGHIVLGVQEKNGNYEIVGVSNVDKIQNNFISTLHAGQKFNHDIHPSEQLFNIDGKIILVFWIPEASRTNKPVYLNGDIRQTYTRKGGCDQKATKAQIERMLRDAAADRWDSQSWQFSLNEAFDDKSVKWYRSVFNERNPGTDVSLTDEDFLYQWGYLVRVGKELLPTRAAIMLFGSPTAIHHMLPRPTLDVQWIPSDHNEPLPEVRWLDRIVFEDNLIITWRQLVQKYMQYEPKPFSIDPHTLMRIDTPDSYRVFREAAINLLIHQDYADHSRKSVIKFYKDMIEFWNPGDVFGSDENILEPGEKEVRNPRIAAAFRRLSLCEQAGTGLRMMCSLWKDMGNPVPEFDNDRGRKAFGFYLSLAPENAIMKATTQVPQQVSPQVIKLLKICDGDSSRSDLQEQLGLLDRENFRKEYLKPAVESGVLEMTIPDKPRSSSQKYRLSESGIRFLKELGNI